MENINTYIFRKYGKEKIRYLHPKLEPILKETYGIIVYQEQVMRIASDLAGFSLSEADILRRAMGKKKKSVMEKQKKEFIAGCQKNGIKLKTAEAIYDLIFKFASYGFNKSHSAAYALLAYQTAYLKAHYPAELMAATLTSEINDSSRIMVLVEECRRMGIEILPPDINISRDIFEVTQDGKISFALAAIKNVGKAAIRSIIKTREEHGTFKNIYHLLQKVDLRAVNKKIMEALVQAGALDKLEGNRAQNFAAIELAIGFAQKYQTQNHNKAQLNMFDQLTDQSDQQTNQQFVVYPPLPDVPDWQIQEILQREKELLGFYISGHPLDRYKKEIALFSTLDWNDPETYSENQIVKTAAIMSQVRTHLDRKGNIMAFVTFEDRYNSFEGVVFASVYETYSVHIEKGNLVFVTGKVSESSEKTFKLLCDEIVPISEALNQLSNGIQITIDTSRILEDDIIKIEQIIQNNPGKIPLFFEMRSNGNGTGIILRSKKYNVSVNEILLKEIEHIIGKGSIHIKS